MPQNLRAIRRKIRTVQNIRKITRAMKMVAAAKLRRVQGQVENGRAYWQRLHEIIGHVAAQAGEVTHPLLEPNGIETVGVLVIGGSRGLCGSYNVALLRHAHEFLESLNRPVVLTTLGPRALRYFTRHGYHVEEGFPTPEEAQRLAQASALSSLLQERFLSGVVGEVHVIYTRFYSAIRHVPTTRQLLPIQAVAPGGTGAGVQSYLYEPPAEELLGSLLPRAIDAEVYEMLLQSAAAEEGARMAAMSAATDNAEEMIVTLNRDLNRARQSQITKEILEVIAGADALAAE